MMFILVHGRSGKSKILVPVDNIGEVVTSPTGSSLAYKVPIGLVGERLSGVNVKETPEEIHNLIRREHLKYKVDGLLVGGASDPFKVGDC